MRSRYELTVTNVGFQWGPSIVTRICGDELDKKGVWLEVSGSRERVEIRVTHGGRLRVGPVITRKEPKP